MKPLWLRRLICYLAGHEYDEDAYVAGSWKLACTRCDHTWRM